MKKYFLHIYDRLGSKLIIIIGLILCLSISAWAYINIRYYESSLTQGLMADADKLITTIRLGTHYAMMLNSRNDIHQIVNNVATQKHIENLRIYNKSGEIKFSNRPEEIDQITDITSKSCNTCHFIVPPLASPDLRNRVRMFSGHGGKMLMGIVSPINNEPSCSDASCHFHPPDKKLLGTLEVVISMEDAEEELMLLKEAVIILAIVIFMITSVAIYAFISTFVSKPVRELIAGTRLIAKGDYTTTITVSRNDEIGELASAFNQMRSEIFKKEVELSRQKDEYQTLFESVPCLITVQDRDFKLLNFNCEFSRRFPCSHGDYCFQAYKGRSDKCPECPVEKTFEDGGCHYSEEKNIKDGKHWIVRTSPIKNAQGEIVAAMEISLDITRSKILEDKLEKIEQKYYAIFNNMPNPVFVLDADTFQILDCNDAVRGVYGYDQDELISTSFLRLFKEESPESILKLQTSSDMTQVRHVAKNGKTIFVNIRVSKLQSPGQNMLLVTTSDITKRLETEQQLIHAGKMATLGEMATGVAHELNQPLTVIKTASSFIMKKIGRKQDIAPDILMTLAREIDSHVDRATKIINHMRQFGRKSDMACNLIQVNDTLKKAFEFFGQQLKLRAIEVIWHTDNNLPMIMGDSDRLEQVFINLLINARDAIEEKCLSDTSNCDKKITLTSKVIGENVVIEIRDTGTGIPDTLLEKVFEPFFTTKQVGQGTGLGLSISYGIVKDCGGEIRAVSEKGRGAAFIITFPIPDKEIWKTEYYL